MRRDFGGGSNSSGFAWGASPALSGTQSEAQSESEQVRVGVGGPTAGGGKKKGNKGKKEVLVKWG